MQNGKRTENNPGPRYNMLFFFFWMDKEKHKHRIARQIAGHKNYKQKLQVDEAREKCPLFFPLVLYCFQNRLFSVCFSSNRIRFFFFIERLYDRKYIYLKWIHCDLLRVDSITVSTEMIIKKSICVPCFNTVTINVNEIIDMSTTVRHLIVHCYVKQNEYWQEYSLIYRCCCHWCWK